MGRSWKTCPELSQKPGVREEHSFQPESFQVHCNPQSHRSNSPRPLRNVGATIEGRNYHCGCSIVPLSRGKQDDRKKNPKCDFRLRFACRGLKSGAALPKNLVASLLVARTRARIRRDSWREIHTWDFPPCYFARRKHDHRSKHRLLASARKLVANRFLTLDY